jgi:hypothetical protein
MSQKLKASETAWECAVTATGRLRAEQPTTYGVGRGSMRPVCIGEARDADDCQPAIV